MERYKGRVPCPHWVDELVIGSDISVKTVAAKARGELTVQKRRLVRAFGADEDAKATAPPVFYNAKGDGFPVRTGQTNWSSVRTSP